MRARWGAPAVLGVIVLFTVTGCGPSDQSAAGAGTASGATSGSAASASAAQSAAAPTLSTTAKGTLAAGRKITVHVTGGTLSDVSVTMVHDRTSGVTSGGVLDLDGTLDATKTTWTSTATRAPGQKYRITANASSTSGQVAGLESTFRTAAASSKFTVDVTPWGGQKVGVGQPIVVRTSRAVTTTAARKAVEQALVVHASKSFGTGAWRWISSTEVDFRPRKFWPTGTKVTVHAQLAGVKVGSAWGAADRDVKFAIGRSFIMRISNARHTMKVYRNGKLVRTVPVSMGRTGYLTRSGIKTIMSHEKKVHMTSASYGGKDFYDETVYYAQRLTWSGEFVHSAPWSVASQGRRNVSHGCTNVSPSNAIWLFHQTLIGDPVITSGTGRQMEPGNGWGGDWDYSWSSWLKGSEAGAVTSAAA